MFLDTFLIAYFFQLTNRNVITISIYYLIGYFIVGAIFLLAGDIVKTKNKVKVYRYGIILNCIFVLIISILGEKCKEYYLALGILYGISQGVYWVVCHALRTEVMNGENTKNIYQSNPIKSNSKNSFSHNYRNFY